ncbi:MAG TPA: hypothetical protein VHL11_03410 [Phototrophicaceae bacterium]|jgi:hypothetical protein|nr:hypothetical protein [Phototrophicaceae bacterium]
MKKYFGFIAHPLTFIAAFFIITAPTSLQSGLTGQETTTSVIVPSGQVGWFDSGITLKVGDIYTIRADGVINLWPNCEETKAQEGYPDLDCSLVFAIGPNGTTAFDPAPMDYPYPGGLVAALVARIGESSSFLVGTGSTFIADSDGSLQFAMNDIVKMQDNSGEFVADITLKTPLSLPSNNGAWQDSGVCVVAGQSFTIAATGTINIFPECSDSDAGSDYTCTDMTVTPNGTTALPPADADHPLPGANVGALVARIDEGDPFLVGTGGTFTAATAGCIQLAVNDTDDPSANDEGEFKVVIVPEAEGETIFIPGRLDDWLNTDIKVTAGQTVSLNASGTLNIWPRCEIEKDGQGLPDIDCNLMAMGPTGTTGLDLAPEDYPLPGGRVGALVAKIGKGDPFLVGRGGKFVVQQDGKLRFRINDIFGMGDNSGGYIAIINVLDVDNPQP